MKQLNLNVTPEFERDLKLFMKRKGIKRKSDAIRTALRELALRATPKSNCDFHALLGIGLKAPLNPNPRFKTEDELWS
jgi:mRNA-degrading endonuclease YafQ of YafQ-DinJ toxin-antitoxin module